MTVDIQLSERARQWIEAQADGQSAPPERIVE